VTGKLGQHASLLFHGSAQLSRGSPHTYVYIHINPMKKMYYWDDMKQLIIFDFSIITCEYVGLSCIISLETVT
jgi:hypothetical protein